VSKVLPDDEHNRTLVEHVRPAAWDPPSPAARYNLVVIGGGTAGLVSAVGAAGLGARVALVERHLLGGDCLNSGCVPSKAIIAAGRAAAAVRRAGRFGIRAGEPDVDFPAVMERMRALRAGVARHDSAARLAGLGVDIFFGDATFTGPDTIEVEGRRLRFARAVIASGTRPSIPPIPGLDEVPYLTNETVFGLTRRPGRLIVIGGGPIGCELAQTFRRLGSEVVVLSLNERLLPKEGVDASSRVREAFEHEGVELRLGAQVSRVERAGHDLAVTFARGGEPDRVAGDTLLVATGRAPNIERLDAHAAGVGTTPQGVVVDDHLRTTNRRVYAAGDICSPFKFTHSADAMARIVIQNALFFGRKKSSALVIPWATYTDPEVAHVGIGETEATRRGAAVVTFTVELKDVDRAVLDGETDGFARVHADARTGRILGATLVAAHAGELIGEMALAMTAGLRLGTLSRTIHPYPTQAEAWKKLGDAWNRSRLTPRMKSLLQTVMRWRR
jgi:pyruvate/2-oxoglutarate dehydrogenase complex dihydrolipoamide dehydrogenase (E3) component